EHGQGGDRECGSNEQRRMEVVRVGRQYWRRVEAESEADRKRHNEYGRGDRQHRATIDSLSQVREIELEPYLEHHQHKPEPGQDLQRLRRTRFEDEVEGIGCEPAEQ